MKRTIIFTFLILLALLSVSAAHAAESISGFVGDATNTPLNAVNVTLIDGTNAYINTTSTAATGLYAMQFDVVTGIYTINFDNGFFE